MATSISDISEKVSLTAVNVVKVNDISYEVTSQAHSLKNFVERFKLR